MIQLHGLDDEWVHVGLIAGEHQREAFLALNPLGQVPVLRDGPNALADAQAIPHVGAWIGRIQALPGYVPMKGLES
ncbi:glutathione S-transferase N-terminal domain-containing protein [Synechococcus sp. CCY 9618]|uniref:glutathione S-transferase N-terminal domain-containing protein n=1 Tax=Synechococcus sp. CCY 9618 TaxID=2815602 RepID=UPI001C2428A8|nr:glutathione S-transferase N-terminal domain-containing protein [Synechococcus sp. CCY 9618]